MMKFIYKIKKHTAEALGPTLDAALYWQLVFMEDCEYESEYIERIEIMKAIDRIRENVFKIVREEKDALIIKSEEDLVCIIKVLDFIRDWDDKLIEDPIDLGETISGSLYQANETQRTDIKELYKAASNHIKNNYVNKEIFEFDTETTFKNFYNLY